MSEPQTLSAHNGQQDQRLAALEARELDILAKIESMAGDFKEHRREDVESQRQIWRVLEDIKIQIARNDQRQVERDRIKGVLQAVVIPVVITVATLLANYLMR